MAVPKKVQIYKIVKNKSLTPNDDNNYYFSYF